MICQLVSAVLYVNFRVELDLQYISLLRVALHTGDFSVDLHGPEDVLAVGVVVDSGKGRGLLSLVTSAK